jgi:hypothetical protein
MKKSEVRIVPVAADCDRRRADPKNPTERMSAAATSRWSNLATDLSTESTKSIKPRPNQAQSSLIVLFRASTRSNTSLPRRPHRPPLPCRPPKSVRSAIRKPQSAISVKASQSQSKCFPIVTVGPRLYPQPQYIVVSRAKCTTNCGLPLHPTPFRPCHPQFPSNPDRSVLSDRSDRFPSPPRPPKLQRRKKSTIRNPQPPLPLVVLLPRHHKHST